MNVSLPRKLSYAGRGCLALVCLWAAAIAGCLGTPNNPPIANAGSDQVVATAAGSVTLDGSASNDPEGDALTFAWKQTLGTPVVLSDTTAPTITFTAPTINTTLTFELTVRDRRNLSVATVSVAVRRAEASVRVDERVQRSVTDDPMVIGDLPQDWLIADAGADLPQAADQEPEENEEEIKEFHEMFEKTRAPRIVQESLAPRATRTVSLALEGPSGLAGLAQWIGTTQPLEVAIALDGERLVTGATYQMGNDRGGSYLRTQTTTGGAATMSVTNTSNVTVTVRISFMATAFE